MHEMLEGGAVTARLLGELGSTLGLLDDLVGGCGQVLRLGGLTRRAPAATAAPRCARAVAHGAPPPQLAARRLRRRRRASPSSTPGCGTCARTSRVGGRAGGPGGTPPSGSPAARVCRGNWRCVLPFTPRVCPFAPLLPACPPPRSHRGPQQPAGAALAQQPAPAGQPGGPGGAPGPGRRRRARAAGPRHRQQQVRAAAARSACMPGTQVGVSVRAAVAKCTRRMVGTRGQLDRHWLAAGCPRALL